VGGRTPTVGALGDVWNSCRGAEAYPLEGCVGGRTALGASSRSPKRQFKWMLSSYISIDACRLSK